MMTQRLQIRARGFSAGQNSLTSKAGGASNRTGEDVSLLSKAGPGEGVNASIGSRSSCGTAVDNRRVRQFLLHVDFIIDGKVSPGKTKVLVARLKDGVGDTRQVFQDRRQESVSITKLGTANEDWHGDLIGSQACAPSFQRHV